MGSYEGEIILTPAQRAARGLLPPGPLTQGVIKPGQPTANEAAIQQTMHPDTPLPTPQPSFNDIPVVDPSQVQVMKFPSPLEYLAGNAKRNAPQIGATIAAGAVPGAGAITGPLARTVAAGLGGGAGAAVTGQDIPTEAGKQALGQVIGEGAFGAARAALNSPLYRSYAKDSANQIMEWARQRVPAWAKFGQGEKGLTQAMTMEGQKALSQEFDKALTQIVHSARGRSIAMTAEDAAELGIKDIRPIPVSPLSPPVKASVALKDAGKEEMLFHVDAGEAARAVTGMWQKNPKLYRRVVGTLDAADIGDPAARAAYKTGTGIRNYLGSSKAMEGEVYHPERAQAALLDLKKQKELSRRGMEEVGDIIRGPGDKPVKATTIQPWQKHLMGGALGQFIAALSGNHGYGAPFAGGALLGDAVLPSKAFRNVPLTPAMEGLFTGGPTGAASILTPLFNQRSTDERVK